MKVDYEKFKELIRVMEKSIEKTDEFSKEVLLPAETREIHRTLKSAYEFVLNELNNCLVTTEHESENNQ